MPYDRYRHKIPREIINTLPIFRYDGEVRLIRTAEDLAHAVPVLQAERVLGFDTETRPNFLRKERMNPPALLQLATADVVYLMQLTVLPLNAKIASVLANPHIVKTGVSILEDMRALQKLHAFEPAGLFDLGKAAHALGLETQGLRTLAANFFGFRITKGSRCSNWSQSVLTARQMTYAATDAWIGRRIYLYMLEIGMIKDNA